MDPTSRTLTLHKRLNAHSRYQIPPFPPRLAPPTATLDWLSTQQRPCYTSNEENSTKTTSLSIFQPNQTTSLAFELAASLPLTGADAIAPRCSDGRYTFRPLPLTRALGLSLAKFGGGKWRDKAGPRETHESAGYGRFYRLGMAELKRRQLRLRYRKHRKQRQGLFPWRRRKTPRVLDVEEIAKRGKLEWLMVEICRMERENGNEEVARVWLSACQEKGFLRQYVLEVDGVDVVYEDDSGYDIKEGDESESGGSEDDEDVENGDEADEDSESDEEEEDCEMMMDVDI